MTDVPDRLSSGVAGLDTVLMGGFVRNGLYIICGAPGAGKTILSNQLCHTHAAGGGRALYVTLLSEQHERLLGSLRQMSFFDETKVGREISYLSAFQLLERDGLAGLLTLLRREIVAHAAGVLVLDGLVAAEAYATTELQLKKFIHELQMLAAAADCTMFLLTSSGEPAGARPEHTMVDGLVALREREHGWRVERELHVRKFRGSGHLSGGHAMRITSDGIVVWPRMEALPLPPVQRVYGPGSRLSTGVAGLDAMLLGGLPEGSCTMLLGPTGAGKTCLALQYLSCATREAPGMMLSFYEKPSQLLTRATAIAPHLPALAADGGATFQWQGASEDLIDRVAADLLAYVRLRGIRRLVIDGLLGFADMTVQADRMVLFFRALMGQLRELGVTTVSTMEVPELVGPVLRAPVSRLTPIAENLILLRHVEGANKLQRVVSVMKLRDSRFDTRVRHFEIEAGGIVLVDSDEGARPEVGAGDGPDASET